MFKTVMLAMAGLGFMASAAAQIAPGFGLKADAALPPAADQTDTYRLWSGRAPGATSDSPSEVPLLTIFRPGGPINGTAVVIAPGGAYLNLAGVLEGAEPARWFTSHGVTAFVLTYRTGQVGRLPIPFQDGARAIRFVRSHAAVFKIDPTRIGMMGFSAGGHLTATTGVEATTGVPDAADPIERVSSRPDFMILGYPWLEGMQIGPDGRSSYCDFLDNYLHVPCNSKDYVSYFPLKRISANTPPTFIYHTSSDGLVPVEGSVRFYLALQASKVPAEMHLFQTGPHGTGFGGSDPALSKWPDLLLEWMLARGLLPAPIPGTAHP